MRFISTFAASFERTKTYTKGILRVYKKQAALV